MARVRNVEFAVPASLSDHRFGRDDREDPPTNLGIEIDAQETSVGMRVNLRVVDIPRAMDQPVAGACRSFGQAIRETRDIRRLDDQIDIRGEVVVDALVVALNAVGNLAPIQPREERGQKAAPGLYEP